MDGILCARAAFIFYHDFNPLFFLIYLKLLSGELNLDLCVFHIQHGHYLFTQAANCTDQLALYSEAQYKGAVNAMKT